MGLMFFSFVFSESQQTKPGSRKTSVSTDTSRGQKIFSSNCVGCHGLDGKGSQRAPNIATNPQVQKFSVEELVHIISEGVPGTGMPAFKQLGQPAIKATVAYVRSLQGRGGSTKLPGDPTRGEKTFFGDADCGSCHMTRGRGGFIGPDLSSYGQTHSADVIKSAILDSDTRDHVQFPVVVNTASGERYEGIVRNEDNFSIQLQSSDGAFHFLSKADVKTVERSQTPLMPSNYGSKLNTEQLNDVVSYLLSIAQSPTQSKNVQPEEEQP
jgi:cytochrome c oxidase cbb3-type subunit 3